MAIDRAPIFAAVRKMLGRGFSTAEINTLDAAIDSAEGIIAPAAVAGLTNAAAFYEALRGHFGGLEQSQVDGFNRLLGAYAAAHWPIAYAAYALATGYWETNKTMQPVREAYWLSEAWRKAHLRYWPWYGRGDVQLTWEANYRAADAALGLNGALIANPDLAMDPAVSARVMVWGMGTGAFTRHKLADFLPAMGPAAVASFKKARRIINGTDRDDEIAAIAGKMQSALTDGGWQ